MGKGRKEIRSANGLNLADLTKKASVLLSAEELQEMPSLTHSWETNVAKPELIEGLIRQAHAVLNIGPEVSQWRALVIPPGDDSETTVISPAVITTMWRVVIVVGSKEVMRVQADAAGLQAEASILLTSGTCVSLPIGLNAMSTLSFTNDKYASLPAKKGFRPVRVVKNPAARYIVVLDGAILTPPPSKTEPSPVEEKVVTPESA